jgi:hypothetical protein
VGEDLLYSHFSGGKSYYIAIFLGGNMARGKGHYTTPVLVTLPSLVFTPDPKLLFQFSKINYQSYPILPAMKLFEKDISEIASTKIL